MSNLTASNSGSALLKEKAMNIKPKILYPSLIIAAFSVTLLSLTGVAALTGYLPGASAKSESAQNEGPRKTDGGSNVGAACANCGTVESVRLIERQGSSSGLGAVAGGVAGAILGNQVGGGSGRTVMTVAGGAGGAYVGNGRTRNARLYKETPWSWAMASLRMRAHSIMAMTSLLRRGCGCCRPGP